MTLVLLTNNKGPVVSSLFNVAAAARLRVRKGQWVVFGKLNVVNWADSKQNLTVTMSSQDGTNLIDRADFPMPPGTAGQTISLQGPLTVEDDVDIVDISYSSWSAWASQVSLMAIGVDELEAHPTF